MIVLRVDNLLFLFSGPSPLRRQAERNNDSNKRPNNPGGVWAAVPSAPSSTCRTGEGEAAARAGKFSAWGGSACAHGPMVSGHIYIHAHARLLLTPPWHSMLLLASLVTVPVNAASSSQPRGRLPDSSDVVPFPFVLHAFPLRLPFDYVPAIFQDRGGRRRQRRVPLLKFLQPRRPRLVYSAGGAESFAAEASAAEPRPVH